MLIGRNIDGKVMALGKFALDLRCLAKLGPLEINTGPEKVRIIQKTFVPRRRDILGWLVYSYI